ncbi:MAG TPA: tRNA (guanosine(37)-N1)-methyltransferase TrmD [Spirochaetia bacterium]|nr:tRNA (guanosine(37)-N1)-methyltransferase TrmD [Spirochaetales bacterium]HRY80813.1 tRNA (guanosine(37)-N1)-methyltransferase TrmD [Spirochaetia bacterium]HRZ89202.1 tRNA (guanosine(37)-N1)-methyltransferase TrmD [Spirochaetia bacterium]
MKLTVLTLFPEILKGFFESSIMKRAVERGLVTYDLVNIRDYATDKHHKCDDEVYGGGAGMLMLPGPLGRALDAAGSPGVRTVFVTPGGRLFNQAYARDLAREPKLVILCGRYEGVDQRIVDKYVSDEISIGDYVLSSGEVAALAVVDAVYRLIDGVITGESLAEESFEGGLLEYPQYTRPALYDSIPVPDVLVSGHHANITRWRLKKRLEKTLAYRPELLSDAMLSDDLRGLIERIAAEGGIDEPD